MMRGLVLLLFSLYFLSCTATTVAAASTATMSASAGGGVRGSGSGSSISGIHRRRRRRHRHLQSNNQDYESFIPSFSLDDESIIDVQMPELTLLMKGLNSNNLPLNEVAYDTIQIAMNNYLQSLLEDYYNNGNGSSSSSSGNSNGNYDFVKVRTEVIDDRPYMNDGNQITMETTLSFRDNDDDNDESGTGPATRQSNDNTPSNTSGSAGAVPSEYELEFLAGVAWNDLTMFINHLLVAATIEQTTDIFDALISITSKKQYYPSTSTTTTETETEATPATETESEEQVAEEIVVTVEEEDGDNNQEEFDFANGSGSGSGGDEQQADASRGDINDIFVDNNNNSQQGNDYNVAAASEASSQLSQNNNTQDRLNPIWPALIVGIAFFLFTIIMLGYRHQKSNNTDTDSYLTSRGGGLSGNKQKATTTTTTTDPVVLVPVLVHDTNNLNLTLDTADGDDNGDNGDDDEDGFEIENRGSNNYDNNQQKQKRCMLSTGSRTTNNYKNIDDNNGMDHLNDTNKEDGDTDGGIGGGSCFNLGGRAIIQNDDDQHQHQQQRQQQREQEQEQQDGGIGGRSCFTLGGRAIIQKDDNHQKREQRAQQATTIFMENQADNQVVNLTRNSPSYASRNESWRVNNMNHNNGIGGYGIGYGYGNEEEDINYCDLNTSEKEKFVKFMQIDGMTLEEASLRVLHERSLGINITTNMDPPPRPSSPPKRSRSSSKPSSIVSQHQPIFRSEVMADGETMVHHEIPKEQQHQQQQQQQQQRYSSRSIINPCSSNNLNLLNGIVDDNTTTNNATANSNGNNSSNNNLLQQSAMVLSKVEASSQVSSSYSYDDRDFAKALDEDLYAMA
jgi:hypothetical protein